VQMILADIFDPLAEIENFTGQYPIHRDVHHVKNQDPEY
jgi:hypothetical protein